MVCSLDYWVRVCYHNQKQLLRRDDLHRQGIAVTEGIARYGHQGGGQRQAGQGRALSEGIVRYGHQGGGQRQAGQVLVS